MPSAAIDPFGQALTLWTVRAAFAAYVAALTFRSRILWTAGFILFLAHVAAAFEFHHHWSHDAAWRDTERQTAEVMGRGWGGGIWFNYIFAVVWAADVYRQWRDRHWGRSWIVFVQAFFAFLFFNATVVFGHGPIRWFGAASFAWLAWITWRRPASIRSAAGPDRTPSARRSG